jgi:molybdopterin converting factor small subunit
MLADAANVETRHQVDGDTVGSAFDSLFRATPGLRNHILDETGSIRPHVSVFVGGFQSDLDTAVTEGAEIRIINAVSGGLS